MKKILLIVFLFLTTISYSQIENISTNDAARIVLNGYVIDYGNKIPEEAKSQLLIKLTQIATENGMGGNSINPRFIIAAKINVLSKDIIAGPPQMVVINTEIVFFIGDAEENKIFSSTTISSKGVGNNENKSFISAIQNIKVNSKQLAELTTKGKNKIVTYYSNQCDFIIKKATAFSENQQEDAAMYALMQVPQACKTCYIKCMDAVKPIFQKMIDRQCVFKLNESKSKWNANPNSEGASDVVPILGSINPSASCYKDALALSEAISNKIEAIEKRTWEFKLKNYNDAIKLEEQRIESAYKVAIAYYQNQPKTITYNRIVW